MFGLGSSIGSPKGRIFCVIDRAGLGASRRSFEDVVSMRGAMLDNVARPMVEATASDKTHTRTSCAILVAFTPPYYS